MTDNELIAEFMGTRISLVNPGRFYVDHITTVWPFTPNELQYNKSWDWLMPVVEKIFKMDVVVKKRDKSAQIKITLIKGEISIATVHNAVVEFIKWYNANKPS